MRAVWGRAVLSSRRSGPTARRIPAATSLSPLRRRRFCRCWVVASLRARTPDPANHDDHDDDPGLDDPDAAGRGGGAASRGRARGRGGVELRVRLSTLLGLDRCPGEIAGWGPVHADLARDMALGLQPGQWRFAIVDEHGRLLTPGITRARPTIGPGTDLPARAGDVVELQVPAGLLAELAAADVTVTGIWRKVIADLAAQHT